MSEKIRNPLPRNPLNYCRACGHDFTSLELFDRHRVGVHAYTLTEGLRMEPPREDGRHCLTELEMRERGWRSDERGRWLDPSRSERARRAFAAAA